MALCPIDATMKYFAYGSNMCTRRLRERVPSAVVLFVARLNGYRFIFHKRSQDGSAKADAFETVNPTDVVWGVVFKIDGREKSNLDKAEGLGKGYKQKQVDVIGVTGRGTSVFTYVAEPESVDPRLTPYSWYKRFVLEGASQHGLPEDYIAMIAGMQDKDDPDRARDEKKRAIKC